MYADEKCCARESDVKEGDTVLLKQERKNKLTPTFRPEPYRVLDKSGNSLVVQSPDGVQYKRNYSHVKKFLERNNMPTHIDSTITHLLLTQMVPLDIKHNQV